MGHTVLRRIRLKKAVRHFQRGGDLLRTDAGRCLAVFDQAEGVDVQPAAFGQGADG
jgi:hypothetical protein